MQGKYPEIVFLVLKAILIYQDDQTAATIYTPSKENLKKKKKVGLAPVCLEGDARQRFLKLERPTKINLGELQAAL